MNTNRTSQYYLATKVYQGKVTTFSPVDYYEKVERDSDGNWVVRVWWIDQCALMFRSDIPEVRFARCPYSALVALAREIEPGHYHIYRTNEIPDVDLSNVCELNLSAVGEVRYRRSVQAEWVGKIHVDNHLSRFLHRLSKRCYPYPESTYFDSALAKRAIKLLHRWRPITPTSKAA